MNSLTGDALTRRLTDLGIPIDGLRQSLLSREV